MRREREGQLDQGVALHAGILPGFKLLASIGAMPVRARFPATPLRAGMYESFYLRAVSPQAPVGVWMRQTVHKRPGKRPQGSVWCTIFDATRGAPYMHKLTTEDLTVPTGGWIAVGDVAERQVKFARDVGDIPEQVA